jgi:hypothetical protein
MRVNVVNPSIIGRRLFTDGVERNIYLSDDGRQYVKDEWECRSGCGC